MPRHKLNVFSGVKIEIMIMASEACSVIKAIMSNFEGNYFT